MDMFQYAAVCEDCNQGHSLVVEPQYPWTCKLCLKLKQHKARVEERKRKEAQGS